MPTNGGIFIHVHKCAHKNWRRSYALLSGELEKGAVVRANPHHGRGENASPFLCFLQGAGVDGLSMKEELEGCGRRSDE